MAVALVACAPRHADPGSEIARKFLDALNTRDPNRVFELLTPDATFSDPLSGSAIPAAVFRGRLQLDASGWKDRVYSARRITSGAGGVTVEWHIQQTHPSGRPVPLDGVTVLDLQDGRIKAVRSYYNALVYVPFLSKP